MGQSASSPTDPQYDYATSDDDDAVSNASSHSRSADASVAEEEEIPAPPPAINLFDLNDTELLEILTSRPMSLEEIKHVAKTLQQDKDSKVGFYSQEDDSPEIQLAIRANNLSKDLSKFRFKLVPSRMKEPMFWGAVFAILKERLVEQQAKVALQKLEETEKEEIAKTNKKKKKKQPKETSSSSSSSVPAATVTTTTSTTSTTTNGTANQNGHRNFSPRSTAESFPDDEFLDDPSETTTLESQLALRNSQVAYLSRQVQQLRSQIQQLQNGGNTTTATAYMLPKHQGHWIVDKDSKEFLEYPDELKANMRKEKKKRLDQVLSDMKFILDSDKVEDTNGYWDCCGATDYRTACDRT